MQDNARYQRVETRFPVGAKELQDLANLAERTKGNPEKLGGGLQQLIIYWSKAIRGEISLQTFCEVAGIPIPQQAVGGTATMPFPPMPYGYPGMYQQPGMYPPLPGQTGAIGGMMPPQQPYPQETPMPEPQEDPAEVERKRKEKERRSRNRSAVASEYI